MRWLHACSRIVLVVAVGRGSLVLDGVESGSVSGYATLCVPPGVTKVAFVTCGSTGRSGGGVESSTSPVLYGARITLTRLGVGVNGGFFDGFTAAPLREFFTGVTGTLNSGSFPSPFTKMCSVSFLFFLVSVVSGCSLAGRFPNPLSGVSALAAANGPTADAILLDLRRDMAKNGWDSIQWHGCSMILPTTWVGRTVCKVQVDKSINPTSRLTNSLSVSQNLQHSAGRANNDLCRLLVSSST